MSSLPPDMDAELLALFFTEADDAVEQLGAQLLEMEQHPDDPQPIREAFRSAHSLKGLASTLGLELTTSIVHALEDLLGALRDRTLTPTSETISVMLAATDLVGSVIASLRTGGVEDPSLEPAATSIRTQIDAYLQQAGPDAASPAPSHDAPTYELLEAIHDQGMLLLGLDVTIDPASTMPAVRAFQVLQQAQRMGDVVSCNPPLPQIEAGELPDSRLSLWLATDAPVDAVSAELRACDDVRDVDATTFDRRASETSDPSGPEPAATPRSDALSRTHTVRVEASRLDALMHSVGELLVQRARVETLTLNRVDPELSDAVDELTRAAQQMQAMVMDVRMVSIDTVFRRVPRLVRDLSKQLGKEIDVRISGGETELDRTVIDLLGDPLVHLVRNAIDHGIETPDERIASGKPAAGTIAISATATGGTVLVRVQDDGRGMQPDLVRRRAVERGEILQHEADALSDEEAMQLCFGAGFSTRRAVTDVSGRGVGLDVVRTSVRALGGDVMASSSDEGTVMTIKLPLTLAIVSVLLVRVGKHSYALPTTRVRATLDTTDDVVHSIGGQRGIFHEEAILPLVELGSLLGVEADSGAQIVVLEGLGSSVALIVDEVRSMAEVVTRPVPSVVASSEFLSASAMLGDGEITFLVDTEAVTETAGRANLHA